ncbi:hypothetical protein [Domibacillus mangrovi]|uniref:Uncharacterized protein n=1 Tax=Domibacillus mangrovi TaxID=1714354 RepID=A0A1Q5P6W0_9BACI|nr:hypothetical protein [Domibacillus mangrovi]OKL37881.1 hypothetical protein BLL40_00150 [Domibacillus mangrovi]
MSINWIIVHLVAPQLSLLIENILKYICAIYTSYGNCFAGVQRKGRPLILFCLVQYGLLHGEVKKRFE